MKSSRDRCQTLAQGRLLRRRLIWQYDQHGSGTQRKKKTKMTSKHSRKPISAPPRLPQVFPMSPEKEFPGFNTKRGFRSVNYSRTSAEQFSSVQLGPLAGLVVGWTRRTIRQRFSFSVFCVRPLSAVLAWAGRSTL